MLVTRNTASADLGGELQAQLFMHPRAIATAAGMLFVFALIPGMPKLAFFSIALVMGGLSLKLYKNKADTPEVEDEAPAPPPSDTQDMFVPVDPLGLEVGYGLISLVDTSQGGELLHRIKMLRKQLALEMGFVMPAIHIRDNLQLKPNEYSFLLKGVEIARGELMPGHQLVIMSEEKEQKIQGIETKEPAFGLPAVWIPEREKESIQARGMIVVDPATVVTTHVTEIVKSHADELLGRPEVQTILDQLALTYPRVVEELVPKVVPLGVLQKVLQRLLRERISIRNLMTVIEILADYISITKNVDILTVCQAGFGPGHYQAIRGFGGQHQRHDDIPRNRGRHQSLDPAHGVRILRFSRSEYGPAGGRKSAEAVGLFHVPGTSADPVVFPRRKNPFAQYSGEVFPNMVVLSHNEIARKRVSGL